MFILSPENTAFNMNDLPNIVEDDLQYCVLDYSNTHDVDFHFIPLIFLDQFPRPAADLKIGPYRIRMPLDWSIVIADKDFGLVEIIELKHLNDREFTAFCLNPIKSYMPSFHEITIENVFPDATWHMPRLKFGHILAVPLEDGDTPMCAFFVRDTNKIPESLDITKIFT
jgi:hypothetical protein